MPRGLYHVSLSSLYEQPASSQTLLQSAVPFSKNYLPYQDLPISSIYNSSFINKIRDSDLYIQPSLKSTVMATPTFDLGTSSEPIHVSRVALAVIITFSVVSLVALTIALWILLRFTCSSRGRRAGYAIRDGRNEHTQWWKHANPPIDSDKSSEMSYMGIIPAPELASEEGRPRSRYTVEKNA